MTRLLYREDIDQVRDRLTAWWNGGDIGRPIMQITAPRTEPLEEVAALPEPPGWVTNYSTSDFAYRVNLSARACIDTHYLGEAVPTVDPSLGPNTLALFLGCRGVDQPGTVWFEPCIEAPEGARFERARHNAYWDFELRLIREQLRFGEAKFLVAIPDLIEGLDTLAAMRGTQDLLLDVLERPYWVRSALDRITESYFQHYDAIYDMVKDERGGCYFWSWAPGRLSKLQCDFSAMISPGMFREFMVPVLEATTARLDFCMYHWDGPGAIVHHDALLGIDGLNMLQWTPGAGAEPAEDPRWWPLYHKTLDSGKRVYVHLSQADPMGSLRAMKREFGTQLQSFLLVVRADSVAEAEAMLALAEV